MTNKNILIITGLIVLILGGVILGLGLKLKPQPPLTACPLIAPACGTSKEGCIANAQKLEEQYQACKYQDICDQCEYGKILTEPKEIDTSNWKTYRNEEYGFKMTYPRFCTNDPDLEDAITRLSHLPSIAFGCEGNTGKNTYMFIVSPAGGGFWKRDPQEAEDKVVKEILLSSKKAQRIDYLWRDPLYISKDIIVRFLYRDLPYGWTQDNKIEVMGHPLKKERWQETQSTQQWKDIERMLESFSFLK